MIVWGRSGPHSCCCRTRLPSRGQIRRCGRRCRRQGSSRAFVRAPAGARMGTTSTSSGATTAYRWGSDRRSWFSRREALGLGKGGEEGGEASADGRRFVGLSVLSCFVAVWALVLVWSTPGVGRAWEAAREVCRVSGVTLTRLLVRLVVARWPTACPQRMNDFYRCDLETMTWAQIPSVGEA